QRQYNPWQVVQTMPRRRHVVRLRLSPLLIHFPRELGRESAQERINSARAGGRQERQVHDARVIRSGGSDVDKAAIEGVRQWRFKPATCGNDPIDSRIQVSVTLTLR